MNAGQDRLSRGEGSALDFALFACLPAVALLFFVWGAVAVGPERLRDFHVFWEAGRHYVSGAAIYPSLATAARPPAHLAGNLFVYPAAMAALFVPFGLLPYAVACTLWLALGVAAVCGAIRLFGVRDWRCYGAVFLWPTILTSLTVGTLTPFLLLALAAMWHWRERVVRAAAAAAFILVSKLFLWPLLFWLGARRPRAAMWGALVAVCVSLLAWWRVGYVTLVHYPALLRVISLNEGPQGYQVVWSLLPHSVAGVVLESGAAVAAGVLLWWSRRLDDGAGFRVALLAALLLSPILWLHYFALLLPLAALRSPRLSAVWLVPIALWATPFQQADGAVWRTALVLCVAGVMAVPLPRPAPRKLSLAEAGS
jgi:Glycosyltransferase family 87